MNSKQDNQQSVMQARTHSPCRSCGKPVPLQDQSAFIEPNEESKRAESGQHVWHRECFDAYLEEGEEM